MSTGRGMGQAKRRAGAPAQGARQAQTVATDYGAVRNAFYTLFGLSQGKIADGNGPISVTMSFATILKIKRLIDALRPLTVQVDEVLAGLQEQHGFDAEAGSFTDIAATRAYEAAAQEALAVAVEVSCERLGPGDFADVGRASTAMIGVLDALGPFWIDAE